MRYLVFLCNNLIGELFASASLLKSSDGSISGLLFLLTYNMIYTRLRFLTLKKSIGNLFYLTAMDEVHEGNLAESMKNTPTKKLPMVPPTMARPSSQHSVKSTCKFQKINLSIYDNSQLPFMSQHYVKSTCKFQKTDVSVKTTHKIWKMVLERMTRKFPKTKFPTTFDMSNFLGNFTNNREIRKVILSSPCLWASFHPQSPL
jgi:hypothetical protein